MGSIVTQLYLLRKNKGISVNVDPVSESKHHTIPVPLFQSEKVISIPCSRFREGKKGIPCSAADSCMVQIWEHLLPPGPLLQC